MKLESIKMLIRKNIVAIISIVFGVLSFIVSFIFVFMNKCEVCDNNSTGLFKASTISEKDEEENYILVDVKGAVKKKGVYSLLDGATVSDAIEAAGGLASNGVTSNINLSKKLRDEMVVYVFSKSELKAKESSKSIVCEVPKCECETIVVDREICTSDNENDNLGNTLVSINKGTLEELMTLDGIGESKAKAIIEYRNANGNFTKIEDIMNVSGIGEKAFAAIKNKITI